MTSAGWTWGVESVIKPAEQRADGTRSGFWRSRMSEDVSETQRLWFAVGGGILLQRLETHDGFDADLAQTQPTAGRSRLQSAGLHPPPLGEPMQSWMVFNPEPKINQICEPAVA